MLPSQMIAEKGSDLVVINPGSANVRIGLASNQKPLVIPHVIAWRKREEQEEDGASRSKSEGKFGASSLTEARESEREEVLRMVEKQLHVASHPKEEGRILQRKENTSMERESSQNAWNKVEIKGDHGSSASKSTDDAEASNINIPSSADENKDAQQIGNFICGDAVLRLPSSKGYYICHPMCRGHLNASDQYSLQQVCDDICAIWNWVLDIKMGLSLARRKQFSVVLVLPDSLDSREIKELFTIVLKDLQFSSAVLHQESVAITLGNGVSSGCVVNIGAQVALVICVEDGVALTTTKMILLFGGDDISRCLLWLQERLKTWPPVECDPLHYPADLAILNEVKEKHCRFREGNHRAVVELEFHKSGAQAETYKLALSELNVPPMGLFYPGLLAPEEYVLPTRPRYYSDNEEVCLEDAFHFEFGTKKSDLESGLLMGHHGAPLYPVYVENSTSSSMGGGKNKHEERMLGLAQAIVRSILSVGRMDLQRKLFSSILLAGGTASMPGLIDAVEERVLHTIPMHESIDTVEVLPPRTETSMAAWKGGVILGVLDFTRETWVQREDWIEGGIRVGAGKKYKDSLFPHTNTFWYTSS